MTGHHLRALWPVLDDAVPFADVLEQAAADLPAIARQAGARITGRPHWHIARSEHVPGSGRTTTYTLVVEAPAEPLPARPYHHRLRRQPQGATA